MSEARDRLIEARASALAGADGLHHAGADSMFADRWAEYVRRAKATIDSDFAHPADLIAVFIETLTCETCGGDGNAKLGKLNPSTLPQVDCWPCSHCNGSKLDLVKVQAVLRQFADAGVLIEELDPPPTWKGGSKRHRFGTGWFMLEDSHE